MNFLIVYNEKNEDNKNKTADFLQEHKIPFSLLLLKNSLDAKSVSETMKNVTHCAVLDSENSAAEFSFCLGYMLGAGVEVYALKSKRFAALGGALKEFDTFKALDDFLRSNISKILSEAKRKAAWKKLFDSGNPFTGDSLAIHIEKDNRDIVQTYIDAGMSLNERTSLGTPMLNVAIRAEQVDEVKWILEHDVDLDAVSKDRGYSALMDCVWKKNLELAKILVAKGVNLDFVSTDNQSALVLAVGEGDLDMVTLLAEAGADCDKKDALGMSAYGYAKLFKRDDLVSVLEKHHKE